MPRILRLSSRNFCSSLVSPEPSSTSEPAIDSTLWAMRSGKTDAAGPVDGARRRRSGRPPRRPWPAAARRARPPRPGPSPTRPGRSRPPAGSSPAASCSGLSTGMATMVVQLGLATIPFGIDASADSLTSGTTRGTSGSMRHADELSTTIAPAAAKRGASWREAVAPLEKRAMSMPDDVGRGRVLDDQVLDPGRPGCARPSGRRRTGAARRRGKSRSSRIACMTVPTCPVAPTTPMRMAPVYGRPAGAPAPARPRPAQRPRSGQLEGGVQGPHGVLGLLGPDQARDADRRGRDHLDVDADGGQGLEGEGGDARDGSSCPRRSATPGPRRRR